MDPAKTPMYLRASITDGCAFRCPYCQPSSGAWGGPRCSARSEQLTAPELGRVIGLLAKLGVNRVRLTGGEPLSRPDCLEIVERIAGLSGIREVAITSNGERLSDMAADLKAAGLRRINVHLDTLRPDRFTALTGRPDLSRVLRGIEAALRVGLTPVKVNTVLMRGINDDELIELCDFARDTGVTVRFIELMDTGPAPEFVERHSLSAAEARRVIESRYPLQPRFSNRGASPAREYVVGNQRAGAGGTIGFIAPRSESFCGACNRLRLTADGRVLGCLHEAKGVAIRPLLREPMASDGRIVDELSLAIRSKRPRRALAGFAPARFSMAQIGG